MLLTIDIGNTQTVLGLFEGAELRHTWRLASETKRSIDELHAIVTQLYHEAGKADGKIPAVSQVIIASVVPALTHVWQELSQSISYHQGAEQPLIVDASIAHKLCADINNPAEVGADRIANALAARVLYGAPAVVLDFGTATNIDVINEEGKYVGGIISPGIQTSASALFDSAARLPVIDLELPEKVLGSTTKTAVQSGLLYGEAAKVNALLKALQGEQPMLDQANTPFIATGGLANLVASMIPLLTHYDEYLTLKGLYLIAALIKGEVVDLPQRVASLKPYEAQQAPAQQQAPVQQQAVAVQQPPAAEQQSPVPQQQPPTLSPSTAQQVPTAQQHAPVVSPLPSVVQQAPAAMQQQAPTVQQQPLEASPPLISRPPTAQHVPAMQQQPSVMQQAPPTTQQASAAQQLSPVAQQQAPVVPPSAPAVQQAQAPEAQQQAQQAPAVQQGLPTTQQQSATQQNPAEALQPIAPPLPPVAMQSFGQAQPKPQEQAPNAQAAHQPYSQQAPQAPQSPQGGGTHL